MDDRRPSKRTVHKLLTLVVLVLGIGLGRPAAVGRMDADQPWVSPHKGCRCAFATYDGGESCSEDEKRVVSEHGVAAGAAMLVRRFQECHDARERLVDACRQPRGPDVRQAGCCAFETGCCLGCCAGACASGGGS